jgi:hypothetical protein
MSVKTNDPQCVVTGHLKQGKQGELICFTVRLAFFELAVIVNIPAEGETSAPVYCKFKVRHPDDERAHRGETEEKGDKSDED